MIILKFNCIYQSNLYSFCECLTLCDKKFVYSFNWITLEVPIILWNLSSYSLHTFTRTIFTETKITISVGLLILNWHFSYEDNSKKFYINIIKITKKVTTFFHVYNMHFSRFLYINAGVHYTWIMQFIS